MESDAAFRDLLEFFKVLSDANRLKIVGLLSQEAFSVEQLAAMLDLRPSTVSHHLSRLSGAGLVAARAEGYYSVYHLQPERLEQMARRLLSRQDLPAPAGQLDLAAYDRKVLQSFLQPDGRLKSIPAQRKKLRIVLEHIAQRFLPARRYSERQANALLRRFHPDVATLRRELVATGLLRRARGQYWRASDQDPVGGRTRRS